MQDEEYSDEHVRASVSVCLSILMHSSITGTTRDMSSKLSVLVASGRSSVLIWRRCNWLRNILPVLWIMQCFPIASIMAE